MIISRTYPHMGAAVLAAISNVMRVLRGTDQLVTHFDPLTGDHVENGKYVVVYHTGHTDYPQHYATADL